jgi:hypothetical protein
MYTVLKCLKCINTNEINDQISEISETPYERLWQDKYAVDIISDQDFEVISNIINLKLETLRKTDDLMTRRVIICSLYKYLATEGYPLLSINTYKELLCNKTFEFYENDRYIFKMMDKSTKDFVYALSGIRY